MSVLFAFFDLALSVAFGRLNGLGCEICWADDHCSRRYGVVQLLYLFATFMLKVLERLSRTPHRLVVYESH